MSRFRQLLKNGAFLAGTNGLTILTALVFAILSTRYFSTTGFGNLVAVLSLTTFLEGIMRGSVNMVLTQRVAQKVANPEDYLLPALKLVAWAGLIFVVGGSILEWFLSRDLLLVWAVLLATMISVGRLAGDAAISIQRGFEQMGPEFKTTVLERLLFLALLFWVVNSSVERETTGFLLVFGINVFTQALQAVLLLVPIWRKLKPEWKINQAVYLDILAAARPLWLCAAIVILEARVDLFLIQWLSGGQQLGVFASAFKIIDMLRVAPLVVCMAVYPSLSRTARTSQKEFKQTFISTLKIILVMAVPISLFTYKFSGPLLTLLFSDKYAPAIPLLQWMSLSVLPLFVNALFGHGFMAKEKWTLLIWIHGSALIVHTCVGLLLISPVSPVSPAVGGALSYFIGETALMLISIFALSKTIWSTPLKDYMRPPR